MGDFSMELNEDQLQVVKWVHDFAENVVRPAAHEWDEREETPWPVIEEAAKIGLYSFDFVANCYRRSDWPPPPARQRGAGLGRRRDHLGATRLDPRRSRDRRDRDAGASWRVGAAMLRPTRRPPAGGVLRLGGRRRFGCEQPEDPCRL